MAMRLRTRVVSALTATGLVAAVLVGGIFLATMRELTLYTDMDQVAVVRCHDAGSRQERHLEVTFHQGPLRGQVRRFDFAAEEWMFEGRIIVWGAPFRWFGGRRYYAYERISGRYRNVEQEKSAPRDVYALTAPDPVWQWCYRWQRLLPFIDALYGTSAFIAFEPGKHYGVYITATGFLIKDLGPAKRAWWQVAWQEAL